MKKGITLVTGGHGFVGKHLVAALRAKGERVRSFDLATPVHKDDVKGSITDKAAVTAVMDNVSNVFHLAGIADLWAPSTAAFREVNVEGALNVGQAAKTAGVARFVQCSSLTTLVGAPTPIGKTQADENIDYAPEQLLGAYPRSKRAAEMAVLKLADNDFHVVIAMPTEPIGVGDDNLTPPTQMILEFLRRKTPAYIDCILNFVPVESLAQGLLAARDRGESG